MPKPKEMEKLAREAALRRDRTTPYPAPGDPMPDPMWDAVLDDPRAAGKPKQSIQQCALADIKQHVLRVECQRCLRIVEMQKADAIRFYGERAIWKDSANGSSTRPAPIGQAGMKKTDAGPIGALDL